jgi:hypothetical protein
LFYTERENNRKKMNIVAVGEDHRGGTVPQESDVTDTTLGRKETVMHR